MCDMPCDYDPCCCLAPPPVKGRLFTIMLLYCWQTEYDKRPYRHFRFSRLDFEERMNRKYHCIRDFRTVVNFMLRRHLFSASISSTVVSNWDVTLLRDFVRSLIPLHKIELRLMQLPREFFVMLRLNVRKMMVVDLNLEGTQLSEYDVRMLHKFLVATKTLRHLNVACCNITQYNFALIADGVHKAENIISLNASRILGLKLTLDTEKIMSLVGTLLMQNQLVNLTLQHCEFVAHDMEPIAEYLSSKKSSLRKLDVAYNRIGADGTLFLMRAIAKGGMLSYLNISGNGIGRHGGGWIAMRFSSCRMLRELILNYNDIDASAINLILLTIKKPSRVLKLNLYGNTFNARTAMILRRLLDSGVLRHEEIDLSYTYDEALQNYRVVPWR
ncbi:uncharacterized protein LOC115634108 [Scaptodrosophila lebanonensis]|uniref:Uncharacterized protein LOC115634108 n=1 Tax=Drosophila lebanonensis TaxID=7225 RepID=A0A6J2UJY8_DROLE|nr:uncharacterized protein LOC115634108 [Scaptodrosophila lebanonensis]XP_030387527.1 uncharacterized protein LOC115634108 [Scaptodrosophila lebanonensis]